MPRTPVFARPCDWKGAPFGKIQGLPNDAVPISRYEDPEEGFNEVARGIRALIEKRWPTDPGTTGGGPKSRTRSDRIAVPGTGVTGPPLDNGHAAPT